METDIRIILFFILFLFALNTNKENYTNVTPVISDKPVEHNRKIKNFYNDIYKYDTESNYNIQPLYDMLYLLEDKLRDTKKDLHYFDKTTCPDGSDKCVTCSPPELTDGAIFKECGNDIDGYQVIPSGETCELGCAEGYHVFGSPPVIGTCQLGNPSPRPDELFSGEFRGTFSNEPYIQCSPDKECGVHTKHIGPSPDKECFCEPGYFGQSCEIPCDESPSNQIDPVTNEFMGRKFNPLTNICQLFCINGESNQSQSECICSPSQFWGGEYCEEIKCIHGRPNEAKTKCAGSFPAGCDPGWTGLHCHQRKCGKHTQKDSDDNQIMDGDKCICEADWYGDTCETHCENGTGIPGASRYICLCNDDFHGHDCSIKCGEDDFFNEITQKCSPIPSGPPRVKDCIGEWNKCSPDPLNDNKCKQKYKIISSPENGGSPCPHTNNEMKDCPHENGCHKDIKPRPRENPGQNPDENPDTDKEEFNKIVIGIMIFLFFGCIIIFGASKYRVIHSSNAHWTESGKFHIILTIPFILICIIWAPISYFKTGGDISNNWNIFFLVMFILTWSVSFFLVFNLRINGIKHDTRIGIMERGPQRTWRKSYAVIYYIICAISFILLPILKPPDTPTEPSDTHSLTPTEKNIDCLGIWSPVNCLSNGKMTYKIMISKSGSGTECDHKEGDQSPSGDIISPICPSSKIPTPCIPEYGDCGGINCNKQITGLNPGRGSGKTCREMGYYVGKTVSCSPSECYHEHHSSPTPFEPDEGHDIGNQPKHSIQIVNKTSDLLSLFISNSDSTYKYNAHWYDANNGSTEGVTIHKPVDWGKDEAIAWDPLGAQYATQVNIEKGKRVILNIPKPLWDPGGDGQRNNQFIIKPIKLNTDKRIDKNYGPDSIKTVVPTQMPNFFELAEGAVSDSSGVDGVNYKISYELTSDRGNPIKTEITGNPCPTSISKDHQLDIGCWNPAKIGCSNFSHGIDPKATAGCLAGTQNCAFNPCSKQFFENPSENGEYFDRHHPWHDDDRQILNESWAAAENAGKLDGGKPAWSHTWGDWPDGETMPPVKHYIGDWKNIQGNTDLWKYCKALNNEGVFSTYCYDYADQSSSKNLKDPYKVKIIFYDL